MQCGLLTVHARSQGRLLMLQARGGRLHLVAEKEVQGAVYTVSAFQARLTPCQRMLQYALTQPTWRSPWRRQSVDYLLLSLITA